MAAAMLKLDVFPRLEKAIQGDRRDEIEEGIDALYRMVRVMEGELPFLVFQQVWKGFLQYHQALVGMVDKEATLWKDIQVKALHVVYRLIRAAGRHQYDYGIDYPVPLSENLKSTCISRVNSDSSMEVRVGSLLVIAALADFDTGAYSLFKEQAQPLLQEISPRLLEKLDLLGSFILEVLRWDDFEWVDTLLHDMVSLACISLATKNPLNQDTTFLFFANLVEKVEQTIRQYGGAIDDHLPTLIDFITEQATNPIRLFLSLFCLAALYPSDPALVGPISLYIEQANKLEEEWRSHLGTALSFCLFKGIRSMPMTDGILITLTHTILRSFLVVGQSLEEGSTLHMTKQTFTVDAWGKAYAASSQEYRSAAIDLVKTCVFDTYRVVRDKLTEHASLERVGDAWRHYFVSVSQMLEHVLSTSSSNERDMVFNLLPFLEFARSRSEQRLRLLHKLIEMIQQDAESSSVLHAFLGQMKTETSTLPPFLTEEPRNASDLPALGRDAFILGFASTVIKDIDREWIDTLLLPMCNTYSFSFPSLYLIKTSHVFYSRVSATHFELVRESCRGHLSKAVDQYPDRVDIKTLYVLFSAVIQSFGKDEAAVDCFATVLQKSVSFASTSSDSFLKLLALSAKLLPSLNMTHLHPALDLLQQHIASQADPSIRTSSLALLHRLFTSSFDANIKLVCVRWLLEQPRPKL